MDHFPLPQCEFPYRVDWKNHRGVRGVNRAAALCVMLDTNAVQILRSNLVGSILTPLKNIKMSFGMMTDSQGMEIYNMFQTTNQKVTYGIIIIWLVVQ